MKREIQKLIYIETTIPSFYHTLRTDAESRVRQKWTRQWWNEYAGIFTLVSSVAVIEEARIDNAPELLGRRRLKWLIEKLMKFAESGTKFQHSLGTMSVA